MPELAVILVVALVVLGPKRLPEVARQLGKAMAEFRRQTSDVLGEFQHQGRFDDDDEPARRPAPPAEVVPSSVSAPAPAPSGAPDKPASGRS